jgi:hypothetical protein
MMAPGSAVMPGSGPPRRRSEAPGVLVEGTPGALVPCEIVKSIHRSRSRQPPGRKGASSIGG